MKAEIQRWIDAAKKLAGNKNEKVLCLLVAILF